MIDLASRWRRELTWGVLASVAFALPALVGQHVTARLLGRAQDLAELLALASASSAHLWLLPIDALFSGAMRLAILAGAAHLLLRVLTGEVLPWRGTAAAVGRAARLLVAWPVLVLFVGGGIAWFATSRPEALDAPRWVQVYAGMKVWLLTQGGVWLWVCVRFGALLEEEHGLRRAEAMLVGTAPVWALLLTAMLEAAVP